MRREQRMSGRSYLVLSEDLSVQPPRSRTADALTGMSQKEWQLLRWEVGYQYLRPVVAVGLVLYIAWITYQSPFHELTYLGWTFLALAPIVLTVVILYFRALLQFRVSVGADGVTLGASHVPWDDVLALIVVKAHRPDYKEAVCLRVKGGSEIWMPHTLRDPASFVDCLSQVCRKIDVPIVSFATMAEMEAAKRDR